MAAAAVAVSAGVVGVSWALTQPQSACTGQGCPPDPLAAAPGEIAPAAAGSEGELLQPLPSALGSRSDTESVPVLTAQAPAAVQAPPPLVDPGVPVEQKAARLPTATSRPAVPRPTTPRPTTPRPGTATADRPGSPDPATSRPPTRPPGPTGGPATATTVWDRIADCESGGDWAAAETPDGFSGGLMFSATAWAQYGGTDYAPIAARATKAQQIVVAERVHTERGDYSAWPGCGDAFNAPG